MTFLQPFILWGLPLFLLPVVIHLLNRLRHRPMPWAAMMFLRSATRKSTRYAKLRQFLILLLRVLAVLALILALSRPLSGGWMGWLAARSPDTILVVLDRSSSMEAKAVGGQASKRERALELFVESARTLASGSRLVLVDSLSEDPQELSPPEALLDHPRAGPSDAAADLPSLVQAAADWISENQPGSVELWVASDLQRSNWLPESERWVPVRAALEALPQGVQVRLLALNKPPAQNIGVAVRSLRTRVSEDQPMLDLAMELERTESFSTTIPVSFTLDGVTSQLDLPVESGSARFQQSVPLGKSGGWGRFSVPADSQPSDNDAYFVYGPPVAARAAVVASDPFVRRILPLAVSPGSADTNRVCDVISPERAADTDWTPYALVLWQGALPAEESGLGLYVEKGGIVVFFPSGLADAWEEPVWSARQDAAEQAPFPMGNWEEQSGPLATTEEGFALPLDQLEVVRRNPIIAPDRVLARFEDGTPLLTRRNRGLGQVFFWGTLPHPAWSRLHDGAVLVPVIQRLLEEGGQRFGAALRRECGQPIPPPPQGRWMAVSPAEDRQPDARAGVYRSGEQWLAVQRPRREEDPVLLPAKEVEVVFGELPFQPFEERERGRASMQSELWRTFLIGMLLFLIAEGFLILPPRQALVPARPGGVRRTGPESPRWQEEPSVREGALLER